MPFTSVAKFAAADAAGRTRFCSFRKVPAVATNARWWADFSMFPGNPVPNYYAAAPAIAKTLDGFDGIFHGDAVAPAEMRLATFGLMTPTAGMVGVYYLCDYLLFYPFIDGDDTGTQPMTNIVTLPRYADGEGCQVMAVALAPTTGGGQFTFTYVNQSGVERTSPVQQCSTAANIGVIATSQPGVALAQGPFLTLADGDSGVRSITSAQFGIANGGLVALVIVKPLVTLAIREINTAVEYCSLTNRAPAPRIYDGAHLNIVGDCTSTISGGTLTGYATFAWSDD